MTEVSLSSVPSRRNPLVISPNLDALLAFDERIRTGPNSPDVSPRSDSFAAGVQVGLPPPPRGPRKMRSPSITRSPHSPGFAVTGVVKPVAAASPAPSIPNPYINPAPTLDVVLKAEIPTVQMMSSPTSRIPEAESINFNSTIISPRETQRQQSADTRTFETPLTGLHRTYQSLPFDSRNTHERKLESSLLTPLRAITLPSNFPVRPRRKRKPRTQKHSSSNPSMAEVEKHQDANSNDGWEVVLPVGEAAGSDGLPLIHSHDQRKTSSSLSLSTGSTNSTHEPPSTAEEPRISISSTIYTQSSHAVSLYSSQHHNSPAFIPELMSSRHFPQYRDTQSQRHRSYVDLTSIPGPDFLVYPNRVGDSTLPNFDTISLTELELQSVNTSGDARPKTLLSGPSRKPPLPNTPKPIFNRSAGQLSASKKQHDISHILTVDTLPPTTNFLSSDERAELIKKSRKLTQVFGKTPGAESFAPRYDESHSSVIVPSGQHGAASLSKDLQITSQQLWPPWEGTRYLNANGRRHSTPLTPDEFSFLAHPTDDEILQTGSQTGTRVSYPPSNHPNYHNPDGNRPSITSFIDLSDGDGLNDETSSIMSKKRTKRRPGPSSPSAPSFFENKTPEELAEAERGRKREKLAKVHRFLGSHVPMDLVLGLCSPTTATAFERIPLDMLAEHDVEVRKDWLRRRRSSPGVATPNSWSDDIDRSKEDLDGREKAINVRRAVKMEKVFGVQPPQTLYHTRQSPSLSAPLTATSVAEPSASGYRNFNQSAYSKLRIRKTARPGTSESNKKLLPDGDGDHPEDHRPESRNQKDSNVYTHYQHSLNSLNDIIDRDDRESLAELHQYLQHGDLPSNPVLQEFSRARGRRLSNAASIKSERRRSLPTRTSSLLSLSSEYTVTSITSAKPEATDFELRRRRAAKLAQFFGVDYRTLVKEVLESIEKGVEDERNGGALNPAEAEDLLQRLRKLRMKRGTS